jgi:hypothetical protein
MRGGGPIGTQAGWVRPRCVLLELSPKGQEMLEALSLDHARELNVLAPQLIRTLNTLRVGHGKSKKRATRRNSGI